mmetsp:Transcript_2353/g.3493  ORF Transcript_2353/g.3493 Transcript_2353/m.3493 type:complete len:232 (-) Transcript_2353:139-834(-)|eukprot:jgi/Bigna1/141772/aug1.65_g16480
MKKYNGKYVPISLDKWCSQVERKRHGLSEQWLPPKPTDVVNDEIRRQAEEMGLADYDPTKEDRKQPKVEAEHPSMRPANFSGLRSKDDTNNSIYDPSIGFQAAQYGRKDVVLSKFKSAEELETIGLERLKDELQKKGMKCGGTLRERAERLWLTKGVSDLSSLDPKLFSKKKKKKKKDMAEGGNSKKRKGTEKGPLREGHTRLPGQKRIRSKPRRSKVTKQPRADNYGPIL